ncbi:nuclear pore protein 84/107 [Xylariomycetidae sp. FL0641]|nr:nuclear pore protein 84/107 [Xylariomycetidae sp. FL0641]
MATRRSQRIAALQPGSPESNGSEEPVAAPDEAEEAFLEDAEYFSKTFDALSLASKKSPAERRGEIFRLLDESYEYAAEKVQALRKLQRQPPSNGPRRSDDASSQDSMEIDDADNVAATPAPTESLKHWEQEAQTWNMLRRLLPLRYSDRNAIKPVRREISKFQSSAALWDEFLADDSLAEERKAIMECLQASADDSGADIDELVREYQQRAERGDIIAYGWLHTRSAIKMQKNVNGWSGALDPNSSDAGQMLVDSSGANPLVTQLDPDVATRQDRKLQPEDEYFERAIWLGCYEFLRRGRSVTEIRDWCIERTEVWRAVSMSAMPLSTEEGTERFSCDPLSTLLWRRTCFALARKGGTDDYERAVYGILSGDIPSVEKVCKDWDDFVFAHYNALLRAQFDAYLMKRSSPDATAAIQQSFSSFNAVQFHGDASTVGERLVSSLESNPKTSAEAGSPMKVLQAAVISSNLSQYLRDLGNILGREANAQADSALIPEYESALATAETHKFFTLQDRNGLRLATHIYIILSSLDDLQRDRLNDSQGRNIQENIVCAYVSTLRLAGMNDLIPLYCSKLQGERALFTLSQNLRSVTSQHERAMSLRLMEKLGIDIYDFIVYQPRVLLQQFPDTGQRLPPFGRLSLFSDGPATLKYGRPLKPDFFGDEPDETNASSRIDESLISSLEWFLLVDGLWNEFFEAGIAVYKRFLGRSRVSVSQQPASDTMTVQFNLHAARQLAERVQCAEVFRKKLGFAIADENDSEWFSEILVSASNGSLEDSDLTATELAAARPFFEMECLVRALDKMETIASAEAMVQNPAEQVGKDFWAHIAGETRVFKSMMQPILHGWLLESVQEDQDFHYLRDAYLPEVLIGYVSVLHYAGTSLSRDYLLECMEFASVIAKKDADIAAVLMKSGRMKEIVEGFANCSKALAILSNENKGPGASSKKMREQGWTRELWAVKK